MVGKWLQTLKTIAPAITRVLILQNPANFGWRGYTRALEAAAPPFSVEVTLGAVREVLEIERVVTAFASTPSGGGMVVPDTTTSVHRKLIDPRVRQVGAT